MRSMFFTLIYLTSALIKLSKPGGTKRLVAENVALRKQVSIANRRLKKCPKLTPIERTIFAILASFISPKRLFKTAILIKPATILKLHCALVNKKYSILYSAKSYNKPGPKGPSQEIIDLIVEMKSRNKSFGYLRIAMQIQNQFGIDINKDVVRRVLAKYNKPNPKDSGPSWLSFIGNMKDSLWSVDLFRCESATIKSYWVMVVMDQFTRRIIGFAVKRGDCNGEDICRMFAQIASNNPMPKYLSSDHDPLFTYKQWKANLRIMEIKEIKTVPYIPLSQPFVERLIGTIRREYLDRTLFWHTDDLQRKLYKFKDYYNNCRAHSSIDAKTPVENDNAKFQITNFSWKNHCGGLFCLPETA